VFRSIFEAAPLLIPLHDSLLKKSPENRYNSRLAKDSKHQVISTANLTIQFGAKPLFDNVSIKFGEGNRYGLIGANGSGKSTFMKILSGDLEPSSGSVTLLPDVRMATLQQNQFGYEEYSVLDTVIMGHQELWTIKEERDKIYAMSEMSEEDGMRVAELEVQFAELDGYSAEARAGELLLGAAIPIEQHLSLMSEVAPGDKLRVLLAQALFADPDLLLLDEPTNNLDINTIRWLEGVLNERNSTMIIISHDRHFLPIWLTWTTARLKSFLAITTTSCLHRHRRESVSMLTTPRRKHKSQIYKPSYNASKPTNQKPGRLHPGKNKSTSWR